MAGRGRGRGANLSFNIETLGFGRGGEALPGPNMQPPPVFPALELKPVPLLSGEEHDYLLALKQEFRGTIRESPYFMKLCDKKKDISRYSDKYSFSHQDNQSNWEPDWLRLPGELQRKVKTRSKVKAIIKPKIQIANTTKKLVPEEEITKTLAELEKKEKTEDGEQEGEDEEEKDEEALEEEYYDEEDIDDTDYNQNYFDNGENYGMDEEDEGLDEGPIY